MIILPKVNQSQPSTQSLSGSHLTEGLTALVNAAGGIEPINLASSTATALQGTVNFSVAESKTAWRFRQTVADGAVTSATTSNAENISFLLQFRPFALASPTQGWGIFQWAGTAFNANQPRLAISQTQTGVLRVYWGAANRITWTGGALANQTHTVLLTVSGNDIALYADGALIGTASAAPSFTATRAYFGNAYLNSFNGIISMAAVWERAISPVEALALTANPWQLFQSQRTRFPLDAAAVTAYSLDTTPGSYALTGSSATTLYNRLVDTTAGSYSLTGSSATTLYNRQVDTTPGSYTLTGVSAALEVVAALTLDTTPGSYTLTGSSATLEYVAALELDTTPGSYTLTGSSATALYGRLIDTTPGSYTLTGSSATALYGRLVDTTPGSYTLTGSSATTLYNRLVDTTPGIYSLTGSPAELISSAGVSVNVTGVSGTGNVGTVSVAISINALVTGIAGISSIGAVTVSVTSDANVFVTGVSATGYVGFPLVWGPVDDGQTPNWVIVDDSHSASWTQVPT